MGEVGLVSKVTVFKKIKLGTHENVGAGRVHLPEMEMHTTSFWWELPGTWRRRWPARGLDLGDALKGLAHLLGRVAPVFVMADPADLHATAMVRSPFTGRPTLYLYDAFPGGVGFAGASSTSSRRSARPPPATPAAAPASGAARPAWGPRWSRAAPRATARPGCWRGRGRRPPAEA